VAAVLIAAAIAATVLVTQTGSAYRVTAYFSNASQLVSGDQVKVSGVSAGEVTDLDLTPNGRAAVKLTIDGAYAPLHRGTTARVRLTSLSGESNRYIALDPGMSSAPRIPDHGAIAETDTHPAVDLDEVLDIFRPGVRRRVSQVIRGSARQYAGHGEAANAGFHDLSTVLSTSARLFSELDRDRAKLRRFLSTNAGLTGDLASRSSQLSGLISNLADTTHALAARHTDLGQAIGELPPFLRRADRTFADLDVTLGRFRPLVDAAKPVARRLHPLLVNLRHFAVGARPTIRDLSGILRRPGANNDLFELLRSAPPLRRVTVGHVRADGQRRLAAFPASVRALDRTTPLLAFNRPYAVDLIGWFDDFSHSGVYDALGGASRAGLHVTPGANVKAVLEPILDGAVGKLLPPSLRTTIENIITGSATKPGLLGAVTGQRNRCPGSTEHLQPDRSVPFYGPSVQGKCDPFQVLPGAEPKSWNPASAGGGG
jgi:phospholipid/cholesterol/gamma-HCH transport system substrate-binding protein